jgi:hypothetical protein
MKENTQRISVVPRLLVERHLVERHLANTMFAYHAYDHVIWLIVDWSRVSFYTFCNDKNVSRPNGFRPGDAEPFLFHLVG